MQNCLHSVRTMQTIREVLEKFWGYRSFRPLQQEAMQCIRQKRDAVVVMPTGGGKSLCYQAPALTLPGLTLVISPLISLMKDQVDSLTQCGVPAERLDSSQDFDDQRRIMASLHRNHLKLLYLSPERLLSEGFLNVLHRLNVSAIAIDEAHCVSMWGHDFRPEYRQLSELRPHFPDVPIGAYTATATEQVRCDIAQQLQLHQPQILVGSFDRPNLVYRVERRNQIVRQITDVISRHQGESGIVYCIRRKDTEQLADSLTRQNIKALPYHAGMSDLQRRNHQEMFIREEVDVIVATIAFGMGIDKSNVRFVIHAGMPKSLEHYQQESGRGGRDGLEAECCLFYSPGDYGTWKSILEDLPDDPKNIAIDKLNDIYNFCTGCICRHQAIVGYFGQNLEQDQCNACDVCLGELTCIDDAVVTAQKILSCVYRLDQSFGGNYTAQVLTGSKDKRIIDLKHDQLSTYNLLGEYSQRTVRDWIEQLVGQGYLRKTGEFNVLALTPKSRQVLTGEATPHLIKPIEKAAAAKKMKSAFQDSWQGVDRSLFEILRKKRAEIADEKGMPAYIVFGDVALRDMARRRPSSLDRFILVKGVGEMKRREYGEVFIEIIREYCQTHHVAMDQEPDINETETNSPKPATSQPSRQPKHNLAKLEAFELFQQQHSIQHVAQTIGRAMSTTTDYLTQYLRENQIDSPEPWLDRKIFQLVLSAADQTGTDRLKPIYEHLGGQADYDQIRIALACIEPAQTP